MLNLLKQFQTLAIEGFSLLIWESSIEDIKILKKGVTKLAGCIESMNKYIVDPIFFSNATKPVPALNYDILN